MSISVIASNFNGAKYLPRLLETLFAQRDVVLEIIVVDRNSIDGSDEILAQYPTVKVVKEPPESGLVAGYAAGVPYAQHDNLFFCNEDMWFHDKCLYALETAIDLRNGICAADPWQWTYDTKVWIHGGVRFQPARMNVGGAFVFRRYNFTAPLANGERTAFCCAGAMLIARSAYKGIGGWDRSFFLDQEDVDLFIRAWQAGWRCATVPDARVYHAVNVSNKKELQSGRIKVSKRRYISGSSSILVMAVKYFTKRQIFIRIVLHWCLVLYRLLRLRVEEALWDIEGFAEFLRRLKGALRYRNKYLRLNRGRTGEMFFLDESLQDHGSAKLP